MLSARSSDALQSSQARFLDALESRVFALQTELDALPSAADLGEARGRLQRRLEAMADTAQALDLAAISSAFSSAESCLAGMHDDGDLSALDEVRASLLVVPSLVPPAVVRRRAAGESGAPASGEAARLFDEAWAAAGAARPAPARDLPQVSSIAAAPPAEAQTAPGPNFKVPRPASVELAAKATARGTRGAGEAPSLLDARVLVAHRDSARRESLASSLSAAGAIVVLARSGPEALEIGLDQREPVDLVLCDLRLEDPDGFGLCRNLGQDVLTRDVPVVLLAAESELLRRAEELGAGAHAYLLEDAATDVILRCAGEALQARRGLLARLAREDVVMGRLDGLTPALILRLVVEQCDAARVTLRDAALEFELLTDRTGVLSMARHAASGSDTDPAEVLPGLLGMRAGQFCVERTEALPGQGKPLPELLAPQIERIRRAVGQVQGANLGAIASLTIDPAAVEPYLRTSPQVVARLIDKLRAGASPSALLQSVSASLLETVLVDLASRGAVLRACDHKGDDLLQRAAVRFDLGIQTPTQALTAQQSSAPTPKEDTASAGTAATARHAETRATAAAPAPTQASRTLRPAAATSTDDSVSQDATPRVPRTEAALEDLEFTGTTTALEESADLSVFVLKRLAESPEPVDVAPANPSFHDKPRRAARRPLNRTRPAPAPSEERRDEASPGEGPSALESLRKAKRTPTSDDGEAFTSSLDPDLAATASDPPPLVKSRASMATDSVTAAAESWLGRAKSKLAAVPRRARRAGRATGLRAAFNSDSWFDGSEHPPDVAASGEPKEQRFAQTLESAEPDFLSAEPNADLNPDADAAPHGSPLESHAADAPTDSEFPPDLDVGTTAPKVRKKVRGKQGGPRVSQRVLRGARSVLAPLMVTAATAGAAYWGISQVTHKVDLLPQTVDSEMPELDALTETDSDPSVTAPPSHLLTPPGSGKRGAAKASAPKLASQAMPLPDGLEVDPAKGLLEINTGDTQRILVDKVFIGRGPIRRIPLTPGEHTVVLRSGAEESSFTVAITAGKRTRLQPLAQATN